MEAPEKEKSDEEHSKFDLGPDYKLDYISVTGDQVSDEIKSMLKNIHKDPYSEDEVNSF